RPGQAALPAGTALSPADLRAAVPRPRLKPPPHISTSARSPYGADRTTINTWPGKEHAQEGLLGDFDPGAVIPRPRPARPRLARLGPGRTRRWSAPAGWPGWCPPG